MSKKMLLCLAPVLLLGACGAIPEAGEKEERGAKTYEFDWPREGIRATLEYRTLQSSRPETTCAGKVGIENYGNRKYTVLMFNVKVFSATRELIATDRFSLSSSLNPGGKAEISFDPHNPLNPVAMTVAYRECPKETAFVDVRLEAF